MAANSGPTELEHTILGVVFLEQPCTAYAVRTVFKRSLAARWTASAGAIYPAMRRLRRGGHLATRARAGDGRKTELFRLTTRGQAALRRWLSPPLPSGGALLAVDPLRARLRFLAALPSTRAREVIDEGRAKLAGLLQAVRKEKREAQRDDDPFKAMTHRAAELTIQAQLQWLSEAADRLEATDR